MLEILHEDNHVIAINKPAGALVQPDRTGDRSLVDDVADDLRARHGKPGNVFVGIVHRLDRPVSGVLLFARTSKGAARLAAQFRDGSIEKTYWAVVEQAPPDAAATLEHFLLKDETHNRVRIADANEPGARHARLHYRVVRSVIAGTLLEIRLETGRAHQIRVQLSAIGCTVVGDLRYGARQGLGSRIALHARAIAFDHPTRGERIRLEAPIPAAWAALLDG